MLQTVPMILCLIGEQKSVLGLFLTINRSNWHSTEGRIKVVVVVVVVVEDINLYVEGIEHLGMFAPHVNLEIVTSCVHLIAVRTTTIVGSVRSGMMPTIADLFATF